MSSLRWPQAAKVVVRSLVALGVLMGPATALAGQGVTLLFKSGDLVRLDDGYEQVVRAMRKQGEQLIELNSGGNSLFVRIEEVLVACRDTCPSMQRIAPRKN